MGNAQSPPPQLHRHSSNEITQSPYNSMGHGTAKKQFNMRTSSSKDIIIQNNNSSEKQSKSTTISPHNSFTSPSSNSSNSNLLASSTSSILHSRDNQTNIHVKLNSFLAELSSDPSTLRKIVWRDTNLNEEEVEYVVSEVLKLASTFSPPPSRTSHSNNNNHQQNGIEELIVRNAGLDDGACLTLSKLLAEIQNTIQILDLSLNKFSDIGLFQISYAIRSSRSLLTLLLNSNRVGNDGCKHLARNYLSTLESNLTILSLEKCEVGDAGAKYLADCLIRNSTLQILCLNYNLIGNEGLKDLANALLENTTLKALRLACNEIGNSGANSLISVLKKLISANSNHHLIHRTSSDKESNHSNNTNNNSHNNSNENKTNDNNNNNNNNKSEMSKSSSNANLTALFQASNQFRLRFGNTRSSSSVFAKSQQNQDSLMTTDPLPRELEITLNTNRISNKVAASFVPLVELSSHHNSNIHFELQWSNQRESKVDDEVPVEVIEHSVESLFQEIAFALEDIRQMKRQPLEQDVFEYSLTEQFAHEMEMFLSEPVSYLFEELVHFGSHDTITNNSSSSVNNVELNMSSDQKLTQHFSADHLEISSNNNNNNINFNSDTTSNNNNNLPPPLSGRRSKSSDGILSRQSGKRENSTSNILSDSSPHQETVSDHHLSMNSNSNILTTTSFELMNGGVSLCEPLLLAELHLDSIQEAIRTLPPSNFTSQTLSSSNSSNSLNNSIQQHSASSSSGKLENIMALNQTLNHLIEERNNARQNFCKASSQFLEFFDLQLSPTKLDSLRNTHRRRIAQLEIHVNFIRQFGYSTQRSEESHVHQQRILNQFVRSDIDIPLKAALEKYFIWQKDLRQLQEQVAIESDRMARGLSTELDKLQNLLVGKTRFAREEKFDVFRKGVEVLTYAAVTSHNQLDNSMKQIPFNRMLEAIWWMQSIHQLIVHRLDRLEMLSNRIRQRSLAERSFLITKEDKLDAPLALLEQLKSLDVVQAKQQLAKQSTTMQSVPLNHSESMKISRLKTSLKTVETQRELLISQLASITVQHMPELSLLHPELSLSRFIESDGLETDTKSMDCFSDLIAFKHNHSNVSDWIHASNNGNGGFSNNSSVDLLSASSKSTPKMDSDRNSLRDSNSNSNQQQQQQNEQQEPDFWQAVDEKGQKCVLKRYEIDFADLAVFRSDLKKLHRLSHPHIIEIQSMFKQEHSSKSLKMNCFVQTPYYAGGNWNSFIQRLKDQYPTTTQSKSNTNNKLNRFVLTEQFISVIQKILVALDHMHSCSNIIHLNLNPERIYFTGSDSNQPIIGEFELGAGVVGNHHLEERMKHSFQTNPKYASPEVSNGLVGSVSGRSDIFSLGVLIFDALVVLDTKSSSSNNATSNNSNNIVSSHQYADYLESLLLTKDSSFYEFPMSKPIMKLTQGMLRVDPSKRLSTKSILHDNSDFLALVEYFPTLRQAERTAPLKSLNRQRTQLFQQWNSLEKQSLLFEEKIEKLRSQFESNRRERRDLNRRRIDALTKSTAQQEHLDRQRQSTKQREFQLFAELRSVDEDRGIVLSKLLETQRLLKNVDNEMKSIQSHPDWPIYWEHSFLGRTGSYRRVLMDEIVRCQLEILLNESSSIINSSSLSAETPHLRRFTLTKVERLENPRLWNSYFNKRSEIESRLHIHEQNQTNGILTTREWIDQQFVLQSSLNEVFLFHPYSPPEKFNILAEGFEETIANDESAVFGSGCYFYDNAAKAFEKSPSSGMLVLARVCLGSIMKTKNAVHSLIHNFDSIVGESKKTTAFDRAALLESFRHFVAVDGDAAYPELILHVQQQK